MKNTYNFAMYRLRNLRERKDWDTQSINGLTNYLHNLRCALDSRHPKRRRLRTYYQEVPKYRGGHDKRGKLPATINHFVDRLRKEGEPGRVISFPHLSSAPAKEVNS